MAGKAEYVTAESQSSRYAALPTQAPGGVTGGARCVGTLRFRRRKPSARASASRSKRGGVIWLPEMGAITLRTACACDEVGIVISATGICMAREVLDRIFDPFFAAKPVDKPTVVSPIDTGANGGGAEPLLARIARSILTSTEKASVNMASGHSRFFN
jgi:hypothetical protein